MFNNEKAQEKQIKYIGSKDFEILDFDPPNNSTSDHGACHFGYNLVIVLMKSILISWTFIAEIFS